MGQIRRAIAVLATSATLIALVGASGPHGGPAAGADGQDAVRALYSTHPPGDARDTVRTVGKLVTDLGDERYGVCSGAIVDSPSGSVIATAAHCLTSPERPETPTRSWFAPGYDQLEPLRAIDEGWRVVSHHTPPGWDVERSLSEILPHDYAFVTVERRDGRTIQEAYGANELAYAPIDHKRDVTPLGYPVNPADDASPLAACTGTAEVLTDETAHTANVGGLLLDSCDLSQGTSGGPWIQDFDARTESGTLVGVMSVGSGDGEVLGRPFPAPAGRKLLARADAAT